jgi:hypothetical protein
MVGLEGFEPPTHGLGNLFPWNPLHCHQPLSQPRHKQFFRYSSAWADQVPYSPFCRVLKRHIDMLQARVGSGFDRLAREAAS